MRVLQGRIMETQYDNLTHTLTPNEAAEDNDKTPVQLVNTQLKVKQAVKYDAGQLTFINDNIGLHKIDNASDEISVTLHCYLPPYAKSMCYQVKEGGKVISITTGFMSFDSQGGVQM